MRPASSADPHVTSTTTLSFFATLRSFLLVVSPALTDWRSLPRPSGCPARRTLQYRAMATASTEFAAKPGIEFGTSGWRARIADEFTFANVRLAVAAIAQHVLSRAAKPTVIVGFDRRFYSEEFSRAASDVLAGHGIRVLLCDAAAPTPAIAHEILRRKADGAINLTASHNPAEYHGLKFSSADGGPALPEVTRDIEARAAKLYSSAAPVAHEVLQNTGRDGATMIDPREPYLARLRELVRFPALREANLKIVCDPLHGCGAGYLDRILADEGID